LKKKLKLPILSVIPAGRPQFQRWQIVDQHRRVGTGERFSESNGVLHARHNFAAIDAERILRT